MISNIRATWNLTTKKEFNKLFLDAILKGNDHLKV